MGGAVGRSSGKGKRRRGKMEEDTKLSSATPPSSSRRRRQERRREEKKGAERKGEYENGLGVPERGDVMDVWIEDGEGREETPSAPRLGEDEKGEEERKEEVPS